MKARQLAHSSLNLRLPDANGGPVPTISHPHLSFVHDTCSQTVYRYAKHQFFLHVSHLEKPSLMDNFNITVVQLGVLDHIPFLVMFTAA